MRKDIHLGKGGAGEEQKILSETHVLHRCLAGMCNDGADTTDWTSTLAGGTHRVVHLGKEPCGKKASHLSREPGLSQCWQSTLP